MNLVERHIIRRYHKLFSYCAKVTYRAKNLRNTALYYMMDNTKTKGRKIDYIGHYDINKVVRLKKKKTTPYGDKCFLYLEPLSDAHEAFIKSYYSLPSCVSENVLKSLDKEWQSYFAAIKDYKRNPEKYMGIPKPPRFSKSDGKYVAKFYGMGVDENGNIPLPKQRGDDTEKVVIDFYQHKNRKVKEVRIVPKNKFRYVLEVVYEKAEEKTNTNGNKVLGIDIGVSNIVSGVVFDGKQIDDAFIIRGGKAKEINQYYNKKKASFQRTQNHGKTPKKGDRPATNSTIKLDNRRNDKIENLMHNTSKWVVDKCKEDGIGKIVIGKNDRWKTGANIGKRNNQNFVCIPYLKLIRQIEYKAKLVGIQVVRVEESYTSKCSFFDNENIGHSASYVGRRNGRLFRTANGRKINADINGALNIIRKEDDNFNVSKIGNIKNALHMASTPRVIGISLK